MALLSPSLFLLFKQEVGGSSFCNHLFKHLASKHFQRFEDWDFQFKIVQMFLVNVDQVTLYEYSRTQIGKLKANSIFGQWKTSYIFNPILKKMKVDLNFFGNKRHHQCLLK